MSKIKIQIKALSNRVPRTEAEFVLSYEKTLINIISQELFTSVYYFENKANKKVKDLNSAIYYPRFKVKDDYLEVEKFNIYLSCYDENFLEKLAVAALKNKKFLYKDMKFETMNIEFFKEKEVKENYAIFNTMSPIAIKNKEGKYLNIEEEEYQKCLNYITNITLESIRGRGLSKEIKLIPLDMKKVVVKEKINGFKAKEYYYINAFKGTFILRGDREDLNDIQKVGLGVRRSESKGCITLK